MSKDLRLGKRCPHLIIEESVTLGPDLRTITTKAPVAGSNLARVYANTTSTISDNKATTGSDFATRYIIPPSGLHSQARLKGAKAGPFRILGCVSENGASVDSNVVTITGSNETATFRLPTGTRVPAARIAGVLQEGLSTIVVGVEKGHLVLIDTANIGRQSRVKITGRGAEAIGFTLQKAARGRQVFPGWQLVKGEDLLVNLNFPGNFAQPARYFAFKEQVKSNPILKVTYPAPASRCPRCAGTRIENDWQFDISGEPIFIEDENLLNQAALKIILTERGSNPYHPEYGSSLINRIGSKVVGAVTQQLREDVLAALNQMRIQQREQARYQRVSPKERLYSINAVEVTPHENDPTAFRVFVVVQNASGEPVDLDIVFAVPGSVALAGSNGQSLGLSGLTREQQQNIFRT